MPQGKASCGHFSGSIPPPSIKTLDPMLNLSTQQNPFQSLWIPEPSLSAWSPPIKCPFLTQHCLENPGIYFPFCRSFPKTLNHISQDSVNCLQVHFFPWRKNQGKGHVAPVVLVDLYQPRLLTDAAIFEQPNCHPVSLIGVWLRGGRAGWKRAFGCCVAGTGQVAPILAL